MAVAVDDRLERLEARAEALETRLALVEGGALPARRPALAPAPVPVRTPEPPRPPAEAPVAAATPSSPVSLEDLLGGRVLAWVGGLAVLVGIVLLLVVAASNGWIGEGTRTAMGAVTALGLLAFGIVQRERRSRTEAALAASAAGAAGLFACAVIATSVYALVAAPHGLLLALAVGATATVLAIRWSAPAMGALGILGALLAGPAVGADPEATTTLLLLAVATASATAVVVERRWDWLAFATFAVATPQWLAWVTAGGRSGAATVAALVGFGTLGAVAAAGFELRRGEVPTLRRSAVVLLALNAFIVAAAGWAALDGAGSVAAEAWLAAVAIGHLAGGLALLRTRDRPVSRELALVMTGLGVVVADVAFATIAGGLVLVLGWAAAAAGFALVVRRAGGARDDAAASLGVGAHLALALGHALVQEAPAEALGGRAEDLPTALVALAAVAAACFASGHLAAARHPWWRGVARGIGVAVVAYATAVALEGPALSVAWAAEAVALWHAVGHERERDGLTAAGALALLAGALAHALATVAPPSALLDGLEDLTGAGLALAACVVAASLMALDATAAAPRERVALLTGAGATALFLASVALVTPFAPGTDPQALVSGLWAIVGVAALLAGLMRDIRPLRLAALALLGATIGKVFLYDLAALDSLARVASFIVLGLLLLGGAFAWQRLRPALEPPSTPAAPA